MRDLNPEAAPGIDGANYRISVLEKRLARLEDLRRWRPMSDKADLRPNDCVLFRRCGDSSRIPSVATLFAGGWLKCEGGVSIPPKDYPLYEWAYIPGQEPAEETK